MRKLKVTELQRLSAEEFKQARKTPLVVVLDNVRSLHNVGAVFRTADAFVVEKLLLCGITSTPPNAEIHKTALGAEFTVQWEYAEDTQTVVAHLKDAGYTLFAIEQAEGSLPLSELQLNPAHKYAIILGNEVKGVQQSVIDLCHACIEIPQYGTKHSLNVSVAAGIVIWKFFSQLALAYR
jgi:tRNA G18 (ribose-2'-O)-methylase SpoU